MVKGNMHDKEQVCVAKGVCMAKRACMVKRAVCVAGVGDMHGRVERACMVAGACMVGGGHAWQCWWACMAGGNLCVGEMATEPGSTHPTGMHYCLKKRLSLIDLLMVFVVYSL